MIDLIQSAPREAQLSISREGNRLVESDADILAAFEVELAKEATASKAVCPHCSKKNFEWISTCPAGSGMLRTIHAVCLECKQCIQPSVHESDYVWINDLDLPRVTSEAGSLRTPLDMQELEEILKSLPKGKTPGADQIFNEIWKENIPEMSNLLLGAVNAALRDGCPHSWQTGTLNFLSKGLDMTKVGNLRPIALLETVYKILTIIVTKRVTKIAEAEGLLSPGQEGFRKNRNTLRQVQQLQNRILEAKEKKDNIFIAYINFSNAYGSIDHHAMFQYLELIRFPDVDLLRSIYSGATYSLKHNGRNSAEI